MSAIFDYSSANPHARRGSNDLLQHEDFLSFTGRFSNHGSDYCCDIYQPCSGFYLGLMRQSAAVLCHDKKSLQTLRSCLEDLGIELVLCQSNQQAVESVMAGQCAALIVDFDLTGAEEAIRMANLLPASQKPALIAVASRAWPGTGQAFHSGANRILYRPLESELVRDALKSTCKPKANRRKTARYDAKTLVYLKLDGRTIAGVSIDIGEQGLALQATEPVPMSSNIEFRCVLPGTDQSVHGHADVIWAGDHGRAGLFFSKLAPAARKQLKQWLHRRHQKDTVRDLLPPDDAQVEFAAAGEELQA
jgi:FixJ family two-component response regulator